MMSQRGGMWPVEPYEPDYDAEPEEERGKDEPRRVPVGGDLAMTEHDIDW